MERVKAYGRDIYWPWFEENMLDPLLSIRPDETPTPDRGRMACDNLSSVLDVLSTVAWLRISEVGGCIPMTICPYDLHWQTPPEATTLGPRNIWVTLP